MYHPHTSHTWAVYASNSCLHFQQRACLTRSVGSGAFAAIVLVLRGSTPASVSCFIVSSLTVLFRAADGELGNGHKGPIAGEPLPVCGMEPLRGPGFHGRYSVLWACARLRQSPHYPQICTFRRMGVLTVCWIALGRRPLGSNEKPHDAPGIVGARVPAMSPRPSAWLCEGKKKPPLSVGLVLRAGGHVSR